MDNLQKLKKKYDHVLIGYNLASFSFAAKLASEGRNFCLLDSKHFGSSPFKKVNSLDSELYTRLPFTPHNEATFQLITPDVFGSAEIVDRPPMTFDKGSFRSFLGFGETNVVAIDAVTPFCQAQHILTELSPETFWNDNIEAVGPQVFLDQMLTDIQYDGDNVSHIVLNGTTELRGQCFYFFDHFPFLFEKVGPAVKKLASQFAKSTWYSSVNLIIHHKEEPELVELDQVYLLKGSKDQPCLGQFSRIDGQLISRWETFLPAELTPDSETTGTYLKEIKKQVKRAFSTPDSTVNPEHILILNQVFSDLTRVEVKSGKLGNFNNLEVHSPLFEQNYGWIYEVLCGLNLAAPLLEGEKSGEPSRIKVAAPLPPC